MAGSLAVGGVTTYDTTISWKTVGGDNSSTHLTETPAAATDANIAALADALSDLSNAAIKKRRTTKSIEKSIALLTAFDEAYADANTKLVLQFQNAALDIKETTIPAPDASFFGGDGYTAIVPDDAGSDAQILLDTAIAAWLTVYNTGGGTYAYLGGFRSPLPGGASVRTLPGIAEPGVGGEPPPEPGL